MPRELEHDGVVEKPPNCHALLGRSPIDDHPVDLNLTDFVDDIAKVHLQEDEATLLQTYDGSARRLQEELGKGSTG